MESQYTNDQLAIDQSVKDYSKLLLDHPNIKKVIFDSIETQELPDLPNNLIEIIIENCANLVNINKSLSNCTQLKELYISDCDKLAEIPLNCKQLKTLYLRKWSPELILELPNSLEEFGILNSENLKKLPESISECKQLRVIELYKNKNLEKLPESLSGCINLKDLSINDCEKIMEITNLPISLDNLDINLSSGENFQSTPKLSNYTQLKNLSLSGNKFTSISELPNNLVSLSIYCRNLETLPDLSNLTNLQQLKLDGCSSLVFTPELTQKLSALEQTCSIRYLATYIEVLQPKNVKLDLKK